MGHFAMARDERAIAACNNCGARCAVHAPVHPPRHTPTYSSRRWHTVRWHTIRSLAGLVFWFVWSSGPLVLWCSGALVRLVRLVRLIL